MLTGQVVKIYLNFGLLGFKGAKKIRGSSLVGSPHARGRFGVKF